MPKPAIDLKGQKFGLLTVKGPGRKNKHGQKQWVCECQCGSTVLVPGYNLRTGNTRSCGCLRTESEKWERKSKKPAFLQS